MLFHSKRANRTKAVVGLMPLYKQSKISMEILKNQIKIESNFISISECLNITDPVIFLKSLSVALQTKLLTSLSVCLQKESHQIKIPVCLPANLPPSVD